MMLILPDVPLAIANVHAASIIVKATVIMGLTFAGLPLTRKCRAALRHALLATVFGVLLVLPMASILSPPVPVVEVPIPAATTSELRAGRSLSPAGATSAGHLSAADSGTRPRILPFFITASGFLFAVWGAGVLLLLLPVVSGFWQMRSLRRLGEPWQRGQLLAQQQAATAKIRRRVEVLLYGAVSGPVSFGALRPILVLPPEAQRWQEDDLVRAIIHELEHVRRWDWVIQCLARVVCACYWFHPLVWIEWRKLTLEAERACDDAVLQFADATVYADQLVKLAERISSAPSGVLIAMARQTDLATRVAAILNPRQQRGRAGIFSISLVSFAGVLLMTAISPFWIVAASQMRASDQSFSGALSDPLGQPLPNTQVTLWNASAQEPVEARTDETGHFRFGDLPAGKYRLLVHEFGPQGQIILASGQHLKRDIAVVMPGVVDEVTVYSNDAPTPLPPLPGPLPPTQASLRQADPTGCAPISIFCRVTPPVRIAVARPIYPMKQRKTGVAGTVVVEGRVETDGLVTDLRTSSPANPAFARATVDALHRWQFAPMRYDGVPVAMTVRVTAHFIAR